MTIATLEQAREFREKYGLPDPNCLYGEDGLYCFDFAFLAMVGVMLANDGTDVQTWEVNGHYYVVHSGADGDPSRVYNSGVTVFEDNNPFPDLTNEFFINNPAQALPANNELVVWALGKHNNELWAQNLKFDAVEWMRKNPPFSYVKVEDLMKLLSTQLSSRK